MTLLYEDRAKSKSGDSLLDNSSLLCDEVLDISELNKTPEAKQQQDCHQQQTYPVLPPTVKAVEDDSQIRDGRVLQNLLRNEEKYLPPEPDYLSSVQGGAVTASMRQVVAEWMLEVVHEQRSQPEVFTLAMNVMDRFLCGCRVVKSQLQLLGSVCVLVASKMREPCPIPGQTLIVYTDHSITQEELKEWELLVLYKLQWELTAITPLDYLDHTLPRLGLGELDAGLAAGEEAATELRRRTETILVLAATDYQFAYVAPSLMASAAIVTAVRSMARLGEPDLKEVRLRLQTVTHTETDQIEHCSQAVSAILPSYLKDASQQFPSPDSTTAVGGDSSETLMVTPTKGSSNEATPTNGNSPAADGDETLDLACTEVLASESVLVLDDDDAASPESTFCASSSAPAAAASPSSRSSSPLSAVDIFTEFNTNVLQAVFQEAEQAMESSYSIMVS